MSSFSKVTMLATRRMRPTLTSLARQFSTPTPLPVSPPSPASESAEFVSRTANVAQFFALPRFASLTRTYSPEAVASKQGSFPVLPLPSSLLADKLYALLGRAAQEGRPVHTIGAVDPVQMTQMAKWLEVVYVSGWAASSLLTTGNNEVGPDLGSVHTEHIAPDLTLVWTETTHTPQSQIRSTVSSAPSSSTTRNTTMSAGPQPKSSVRRWSMWTISGPSSLTQTQGESFSSRLRCLHALITGRRLDMVACPR
jgi:hypothetical protein